MGNIFNQINTLKIRVKSGFKVSSNNTKPLYSCVRLNVMEVLEVIRLMNDNSLICLNDQLNLSFSLLGNTLSLRK